YGPVSVRAGRARRAGEGGGRQAGPPHVVARAERAEAVIEMGSSRAHRPDVRAGAVHRIAAIDERAGRGRSEDPAVEPKYLTDGRRARFQVLVRIGKAHGDGARETGIHLLVDRASGLRVEAGEARVTPLGLAGDGQRVVVTDGRERIVEEVVVGVAEARRGGM